MKKISNILYYCIFLVIAGCQAAELEGKTPDGKSLVVWYYDGGTKLDDLLIINEKNYFGKASEPNLDDPLGDVAFRLNSGERIRAECVEDRKNSLDKPECVVYEVFRSDFSLVPEGTRFPRPKVF